MISIDSLHTLLGAALLLAGSAAQAKPVKVFILAGQSNMYGQPSFPRSGHRLFQRPSPQKQFPTNEE